MISIFFTNNNYMLMKQRNIFCLSVERFYIHITQLYLNCQIADEIHKEILPFFEYKEVGIDVDYYECESFISSNESLGDAYRVGLENV